MLQLLIPSVALILATNYADKKLTKQRQDAIREIENALATKLQEAEAAAQRITLETELSLRRTVKEGESSLKRVVFAVSFYSLALYLTIKVTNHFIS